MARWVSAAASAAACSCSSPAGVRRYIRRAGPVEDMRQIGPATAEALGERRVGVGVCPLHPRIPALANPLAAAPIGFRAFGRPEPLVVDPGTRSVTGPGGAVELSDLQFALLASLSRRPGHDMPDQRAASGSSRSAASWRSQRRPAMGDAHDPLSNSLPAPARGGSSLSDETTGTAVPIAPRRLSWRRRNGREARPARRNRRLPASWWWTGSTPTGTSGPTTPA